MGGVFVVLLAGMGLACATSVLEYVWNRKNKAKDSSIVVKSLASSKSNTFKMTGRQQNCLNGGGVRVCIDKILTYNDIEHSVHQPKDQTHKASHSPYDFSHILSYTKPKSIEEKVWSSNKLRIPKPAVAGPCQPLLPLLLVHEHWPWA